MVKKTLYLVLIIQLCLIVSFASYLLSQSTNSFANSLENSSNAQDARWQNESMNLNDTNFKADVSRRSSRDAFVRSGCNKPEQASNFTVCQRLPYSNIVCGKNAPSKTMDRNGNLYKVPNIVHVVWFGIPVFTFYNYLSLRSIASIQQPEKIIIHYNKGTPTGNIWKRAVSEISCIEFNKVKEPTQVLGVNIQQIIAKTDAARIKILIKSGGIYIDLDVITLKSLDALRIYPLTLGRSIKSAISMGVVLAEPNSKFLLGFNQQYPRHFDASKPWSFTTRYLFQFYKNNPQLEAHVEETSLQRPNPYLKEDGGVQATTSMNWDLSDNYVLHIHPSKPAQTGKLDPRFSFWGEEKLRKMDNVYGEAARIALFGSADLIFKPEEGTKDRIPTHQIKTFKPISRTKVN